MTTTHAVGHVFGQGFTEPLGAQWSYQAWNRKLHVRVDAVDVLPFWLELTMEPDWTDVRATGGRMSEGSIQPSAYVVHPVIDRGASIVVREQQGGANYVCIARPTTAQVERLMAAKQTEQ